MTHYSQKVRNLSSACLKNLHLSAFLCVLLGSLWSTQSYSQVLDLNSLSRSVNTGIAKTNRNKSCTLLASPVARDFSGRWYQDYRITGVSDQQPDTSIRGMTGGVNVRNPDFQVDQNTVLYRIQVSDSYLLEILAPKTNPSAIQEFRLIDVKGVTGAPGTLLQCANVTQTPRP